MIYCKTDEEIELIRESCILVGKTHAEVAKLLKPGVNTKILDETAETFIRDNGAIPAFKGYRGFPWTLCISLNSIVVHGFPSTKTELKEGDIISIDCGTLKNGWYGDSAYTYAIGEISKDVQRLLDVTKECLYKGIEMAVHGKRVGDISWAVQEHAEKNGYGVVRELVGHGVGRKLHEDPEVPNFGRKGNGPVLREGTVIAIEPMINMGKRNVMQEDDGWTVKTEDGKPSAHFEHTVAVRKEKAEILTTFEFIEEVIGKRYKDIGI